MEFESAPRILRQYVRAAFASGELSVGQSIPRIEAELEPTAVSRGRLKRYRKVCGFPDRADSNTLPITFPHILAFPLHMAVLTNPEFPLKLLGLVHLRNRIEQLRPIASDAELAIKTWVEGHRRERLGVEFDLHTEVFEADQLVWRSVSTNLSRRKSKPPKKDSEPEAAPNFDQTSSFKVASNTGRRYARVSGDINPIHLAMPTAKALGFKRAIAHGMWTKARMAAALDSVIESYGGAAEYAVEFRKPVFLPSRIQLHWARDADQTRLAVTGTQGASWADKLIHMTGQIKPLA